MVIATVPLIVLVIGLIIYFLPMRPEQAKVTEVGRIMFWVGLLALMLANASNVVRLD